MADSDSTPEQHVSIHSLYGRKTREGLVHIKIGDLDQQWHSSEARRVGYMLIEAAEAADSDTFIMRWLQESIGVTDERQAAMVLKDFREMRSREPSILAKTFHEIVD